MDTDLTRPASRQIWLELSRRQIVAGAGAALLATLGGAPNATAQAAIGGAIRQTRLRAVPADIELSGRAFPAWTLDPSTPIRGRLGETLTLMLANDLPVPIALTWRGIDGAPELAALTAVPQLAAGARTQVGLALRQPGTFLCDLGLLGQSGQMPVGVLVVEEPTATSDRDEVLVFEERRHGPDLKLLPPGAANGTTSIFTVNGLPLAAVPIGSHERLRLRLVNGSPRSIIALKFEGRSVTVIAIDGAPADPFPAREGELTLAPGTRIDVVIDGSPDLAETGSLIRLHDGTAPRLIGRLFDPGARRLRQAPLPAVQPLPATGLPERLDLQRALRVELAFDGTANGWAQPGELTARSTTAFRVKRGRVVVVTLVNRAAAHAVFHLHGHHARLLDRLDDGWKPFWLDTITVAAGQTQRITFLADQAGAWLIDGILAQWNAPRLAQWFAVEN